MAMKSFRPIFLIGPGRSGTTLLYKLLSLHPDIGYVSNYDARFPDWAPTALLSRLVADRYRLKRWSWFADSGNAYVTDRTWLRKAVPTPTEGETLYARNGISWHEVVSMPSPQTVARLRREFIWLQRLQNSRVLLSKCTANNRRIRTLAAAFPEARYIYLIRDGRAVALSLIKVHWWNDHSVWWAGNKTPREMASEGVDMLAIAARNWTEEVRAIQDALKAIPNQNLRCIRYEELLKNPLQQINGLLDFIGVDRSVDYDKFICRLGISERPEGWSKLSAPELDMVMRIEREWLQELNYS